MSIRNEKIRKAREEAMNQYLENCLKQYGKQAKEYLDQALGYFMKNPFETLFKVKVMDAPKEFWDALRLMSAKREDQICVKPALFSRGKTINFYAKWPYYDDNWTYSPDCYKINHKNHFRYVELEE